MESQSQNPEFRIDPENFHPCICFSGELRKDITFLIQKSIKF